MPTLIVAKSVIEGDSLNAHDLLEQTHQIPPYQRDYVWTHKVVEQLWNDLIAHYKKHSKKEQLPNPDGYFLGAMVIIEDAANKVFEVVDGQQRLTSLSTIMTVLFDYLEKLNVPEPYRSGYEKVARDCLGQFVGGDWEANLKFSDNDVASFFLNSCLIKKSYSDKELYWNDPWCASRLVRKTSAIHRIRDSIKCGYEKLDNFLNELSTDDEKRDRLISFFRLVTECVVVLKIKAYSHSNAYAIFESLNNRGIRLSQADLIKNELLKVADSSERDEIVDNWTFARQNVDSTEAITLPDFLHFSYLSRRTKVKANELYENVKNLVTSANGIALVYSKELYDDAAAFDGLTSNYDAAWTAETHYMLNDIKNVLGIKLCYPYLLSAYRKYSATPHDFEAHVKLIMNFAFRFLKVIDGGVEALAGAVNEASLLVNQGKTVVEISDQVFKKYAPDAPFLANLETASFSNIKLAYFVVYYLEKVMMKGSIPLPHGLEQNLEHIMPRTPTKKDWHDIAKAKEDDSETFKDYLWRIGNLLPLPESINKSIKNKGIDYKLSNGTDNEYTAASLTLVSPKQVPKYLIGGKWTYESIVLRQRDLVHNYAAKAWAL